MSDRDHATLSDHDASPEGVRRAWEDAALRAMVSHAEAGVPVTTWDWENGRVVQVPASDFLDQRSDKAQGPRSIDAGDQDPARGSA